jgi:hypothetical protein
MNRTLKSFGLGLVMLLVLTFLAPDATAQCVNCKPSGSCFTCAPSTSGGCECQTASCVDCLLTNPCTSKAGCPQRATQEGSGVKVDEATILEIAQAHPRFAIALASLNKVGGLRGTTEFKTFPVQLSASDVPNWLIPAGESKTYFQDYAAKNVKGADIIVIKFTLTNVSDARVNINGEIISDFPDDPPQTRIEIELDSGKVIKWSVN